MDRIYKIFLSAVIAVGLLIAQIYLVVEYVRKKGEFSGDLKEDSVNQKDKPKKSKLVEMIAHWEVVTGGK